MSFAFVQVNDPDPILWILIYGAMAAISVMAIFEFYIPKLLWLILVSYLIYAVFLFSGFIDWLNSENKSLLFDDLAKMQYVYIEEAREFLGLAICIMVLAFYLVRTHKNKPA
jgi:hypothetical protein